MANKRLEGLVALAKDLVIVLRDAAIILLAVLLVLFPNTFNSIMVNAGFQEGNIVGFTWKSNLEDSNSALEQANKSIEDLQEENDKLVLALEEAKKQLNDAEFKKKLNLLKDENTNIKNRVNAVQKDVRQVIQSNEPVLKKINTETKKNTYKTSDYIVGLQTVGVSEEQKAYLDKRISKVGFKLDDFTYSYKAKERPNWFALTSTVFYYSNASRSQAESLAKLMQRLTRKKFTVRRGDGLGVDPAKKHLTFFVHYIGDE